MNRLDSFLIVSRILNRKAAEKSFKFSSENKQAFVSYSAVESRDKTLFYLFVGNYNGTHYEWDFIFNFARFNTKNIKQKNCVNT